VSVFLSFTALTAVAVSIFAVTETILFAASLVPGTDFITTNSIFITPGAISGAQYYTHDTDLFSTRRAAQ